MYKLNSLLLVKYYFMIFLRNAFNGHKENFKGGNSDTFF